MGIRRYFFVLYTLFIIILPTRDVECLDWPMWRYDAGRTASSPGNLPKELYLLWVRQYKPRTMVWDDPLNQDIMPYDRIFEPVVMGKTMFLGFNDSDKVVALDTDTGKEKWAYYIDGPVRFPPVAQNGKVYFASDDGYLYCIGACNGTLLWKFRGGPSDNKILGNKRLISVWPARGGPVIKDGIVYFAASIWPFMGIFIYALDAKTGKIIWNNDSNGSHYILQPHNAPSFAGVAPQGAFVVAGDKLLVPGGRSVPACFDRFTGKFLYYELASNSKTGGSFVCALSDVFFNHHRERVTTMYDLKTGNALVKNIGNYPVLTEEKYYFSGKSVIGFKAGKINNFFLEREDDNQNEEELIVEKLKERILWELPVNASGDLIKAGNRLYAAGDSRITAINLKSGVSEPTIAWVKSIEGKVERLIAADNKLFAVTLDGRIMAFGKRKSTPIQIQNLFVKKKPSIERTQEALEILKETGVTTGYALLYGVGDGDLIEALISYSQLHIIGIDPDVEKVLKLRRRFDEKGLYGERVAVLLDDPLTLQAPPYMASITIIHDLDLTKYNIEKTFLDRIYKSMRPYGGVTWLSLEGKIKDEFSRMFDESKLLGLKTVVDEDFQLLIREGPLPEAGEWTHNYGNIANTSKSDDKLVKLPLGLLWFGGNSNLDVLPRHGHGPTEQVIGGRLFIEGIDCLSARDVYTGRIIWKVKLQDTGNFGVYYDNTYEDTPTSTNYNQVHIPGANIRGTNFVATTDRVYIIQGRSCHVLDAITGKTVNIIILPTEDSGIKNSQLPQWGYIGVYKDFLIAGHGFVAYSDLLNEKKEEYSVWEIFDKSASKGLIIMDRYSGEILWRINSQHGFLHNGIAVGNDRLYCLDKFPPYIEGQLRRRGKANPNTYRLLALDIKTGEIIWEKNNNIFGTFLSFSEEYGVLVQSTRPSRDMVKGEDGERIIAYKGEDGSAIWDENLEYSTFPILHNSKIITESGMFDLLTGEPVFRQDPLTGKNIRLTWERHYGCNYPIASENLITFRSGAAGFFDLVNNGGTGNFGGFKSGCTSNLVAADGVLNAPDYTRTCSCSYQNQTSLALAYMPDVEVWTFNPITWDGDPIKRVGINFGAPGDRLADNGTLWLDYPSVGGDSPDIPVFTIPETPDWYHSHSSSIKGESLKWVAASGAKGLNNVIITLSKKPMKSQSYTVRLYFAEPEDCRPGERVFDLAIQGKRVLKNFDIVKETGGQNSLIVKEFKNIKVVKDIVIALNPNKKAKRDVAVISGIEIIAEE